jgi:hypothetical protein
MPLLAQRLLLAAGLVALAALLIEIGLSVAATIPSSQPARVVTADAGPYPLRVSLYADPARAGFAVPFAIAPAGAASGLTFPSGPAEVDVQVSTLGRFATYLRHSCSPGLHHATRPAQIPHIGPEMRLPGPVIRTSVQKCDSTLGVKGAHAFVGGMSAAAANLRCRGGD